jgi:hypothetical protein
VVAAWGCGVPAEPRGTPLDHDAYVWQRAWVGPVRAAVARPPEVIAGLRVLGLELERDRVRWPEVDAASLAAGGRPVVLVVRVNAPRAVEDVPMPEVAAVAARWRSAGADVRGIEIDYDCATARLSAYAAWLSRARPTPPLTWSITALPTWSDSDALGAVAAAVDELVVQVHAVRAPVIFDGAAARADLARFAAAAPVGKLRVSLPTYDATVGGVVRRSDPEAVAAFVRWLGTTAAPAVRGVVWFRLPVAGDDRAWSVATLEAVIAGRSLASQVAPRLVATADGGYDVVLENRGNLRGRWPDVAIGGDGLRAELIAGYRAAADGRHFTAPARELAPGATAVVGWATGRALTIDAAP